MKQLTALTIIFLMSMSGTVVALPPEKVGVLVLAHGGSETWNQSVLDATQSIKQKYPVEVAFGMALPQTIQEGIDNLESKGVTKIIVVPLFVSSHSFIIRQTEYLLRKRDVLADPPVVMDHSSGAHHASANAGHADNHSSGHAGSHGAHSSGHQAAGHQTVTLQPLNFKSEIVITSALDDHPLVADILYSRIKELSTDPSRETVIIVGHGPNPEEDNKNWVKSMESLAAQIQQKQMKDGTTSRLILSVTVRDDADKEIYDQAKEHLRGLVRQASQQGKVIVVPLLLSKGGVEKGIVKRLDGLNYVWNGKTLLPDPGIAAFIEASVKDAIKK